MDCDGVVFDSNRQKTEAFATALADYPEPARQAFLEHHRAHGGVSRYAKLRHFFSAIAQVADCERATQAALDAYASIVRDVYRQLEPRAEALTFAARMGGASRVFVVSGSDGDELQDVFQHHQISDCFAAVLGSPTAKTDHVRRICAARSAGRFLVVGDGRADLEAALSIGAHFVFLAEMSEWADANAHLARYRSAAAEHGAVLTRVDTWSELLSWVDGEGMP
jgi:phosphoglycolate phosphatase-like HAD superfamily hydrolase